AGGGHGAPVLPSGPARARGGRERAGEPHDRHTHARHHSTMSPMRTLRLLVLLLAACPPSTQEVDVPASSLDLDLIVADTAAAPSDGKVPIVAQLSYNGDSAELGGGATPASHGAAPHYRRARSHRAGPPGA